MSGDPYGDRRVVSAGAVPPVAPAQRVVHERVVLQQAAAPVSQRRVFAALRFSPPAVLTVLAAISLGVVGAVAIARAGLDGPLDEPIVEVADVSPTAVLGLIEVGMPLLVL